MDCEATRERLGAWIDGELVQADAALVRAHVESCPSCSAERRRLERLQASLLRALQTESSRIAFEPFWEGVRRRISEQRSWRELLWDWALPAFQPRRLAWAVPLAIVVLLAYFSLAPFSPGWRWPANRSNGAAVDSIDGHGFNVAVLRESKTKTTVIWLFDSQEEDDEASKEAASAEPSF
jgi:anti-sigma factor RsiW